MTRETPTVTFRCPPELRLAIEHIAYARGWQGGSVGAVIIDLLKDALAKHEQVPAGLRVQLEQLRWWHGRQTVREKPAMPTMRKR